MSTTTRTLPVAGQNVVVDYLNKQGSVMTVSGTVLSDAWHEGHLVISVTLTGGQHTLVIPPTALCRINGRVIG